MGVIKILTLILSHEHASSNKILHRCDFKPCGTRCYFADRSRTAFNQGHDCAGYSGCAHQYRNIYAYTYQYQYHYIYAITQCNANPNIYANRYQYGDIYPIAE